MGRKLTDNEVLALKEVLIEGVHSFDGFVCSSGYGGMGGSNRSAWQGSPDEYLALSELGGQPIKFFDVFELCSVGVAAVIDNDIYYVCCDSRSSSRHVFSCTAPSGYDFDDSIAYDTHGRFSLLPAHAPKA